MLLPERVSVPAPDLVKLPVPMILLDMVIASLRLMARVPLLVIALLEEMEPEVLPAPIWRVPAAIVVAPVYEFAPERISVPRPSLVSVPVLVAIALLMVVFPAPPMVRFCVPLMPPERVRRSASELMRVAPARAMAPP